MEELVEKTSHNQKEVSASAAVNDNQTTTENNIKVLEDRTKLGFNKVKSDFKDLTESLAATQKETDAEQDKVLE